MQLNDHTDYGLRILMTLGASTTRRWSARELADLHGLSFTHVQKVVQSLEGANLVDTFRGRGGGVSLALPPSEITIGDVVSKLETHMNLVRCFGPGDSGCALEGGCALAAVLYRARAAFQTELDAVTLEAVINRTPFPASLTG
ncbi:MAG: Rrf2 family transcriptional regulator [Gemmatimonadetes bacterium]|nr:Rrf2 family transcriptional regulator [Gemmatimonadota bacterium]NNF11772.1 Rrf2 family transcriptional regulator [Gemmatimonadota bacterium]